MEDEPKDAELFEEVLDDLGLECEVFNRADRLIESLDRASILFLDIDLPVMSGIEILKNIRRNPKYRKLPIVMLTVNGHAITVQVTRRLGANLFLEKSSNFYCFREVIEKAVAMNFATKVNEEEFLVRPRF